MHVTLLTVGGREDYLRQTIESWSVAHAAARRRWAQSRIQHS